MLCVSLCACTPIPDSVDEEEIMITNKLVRVESDEHTRSLTEGITLHGFLYNMNFDTDAVGTYVYHASDAFLKSCSVDNEGQFANYDATKGIYGHIGTKYLAMVSPALPVYEWNSRIKALITYPNKKVDGKDAGMVYATRTLQLIDAGEYKAVNFDDNILYEIRSKIGFIIRRDPTLNEAIEDIKIKVFGAGSDMSPNDAVLYFPATRQCSVPTVAQGGNDESYLFFDNPREVTDEQGQCFKSDVRYLLSGIYAPRSITASILNLSELNSNIIDKQYLSMQMEFKQGDRPVSSELMLNTPIPELMPRHEYLFDITVSSTLISIELKIYNDSQNNAWENKGSMNATIGDPSQTIQVGTFTIRDTNHSWDTPNGSLDQTIE